MKRTLLKSLSYRTMSILITSSIIYVTTGGNTDAIMAIVGVDSIVKMGAFSIHEAVWNKL